MIDITLLTDSRYVNPTEIDWYVGNILEDDRLVRKALERRGLKVARTHWDNPDVDWSQTRYAIFRTTWDYFHRFEAFDAWLNGASKQTTLLNPMSLIRWNIDKHYLQDLEKSGVRIPPTVFIEPGDSRSLAEIVAAMGWSECILKPAISGTARHTYRFVPADAPKQEAIFKELIAKEAMLVQEFQQHILHRGEVAYVLFGGKYSHAVLKKAKPGDFRVQDDFGGTLHDYAPSAAEIAFAEEVVSKCKSIPVYARVDAMWDNDDQLCVSELELIEPELWFRRYPPAAEAFADAVEQAIKTIGK